MEELQSAPALMQMNESMKIDRVIAGTVGKANRMISEKLGLREETVADSLTSSVPWDLDNDLPLFDG